MTEDDECDEDFTRDEKLFFYGMYFASGIMDGSIQESAIDVKDIYNINNWIYSFLAERGEVSLIESDISNILEKLIRSANKIILDFTNKKTS